MCAPVRAENLLAAHTLARSDAARRALPNFALLGLGDAEVFRVRPSGGKEVAATLDARLAAQREDLSDDAQVVRKLCAVLELVWMTGKPRASDLG
ncbi:hypothetical protein GCM10011583_62600 [Streptomyces camponoticapitis]|uniref:Uncharacterized protein n=1 Tax=Streptomyces camponoticapitis TaxID=1616125 RepID=A0ABQ2EUB1_9ACTN|nr:hypothetical protein GCM10011583_62600 [Streptomyces camponoticapitis]